MAIMQPPLSQISPELELSVRAQTTAQRHISLSRVVVVSYSSIHLAYNLYFMFTRDTYEPCVHTPTTCCTATYLWIMPELFLPAQGQTTPELLDWNGTDMIASPAFHSQCFLAYATLHREICSASACSTRVINSIGCFDGGEPPSCCLSFN